MAFRQEASRWLSAFDSDEARTIFEDVVAKPPDEAMKKETKALVWGKLVEAEGVLTRPSRKPIDRNGLFDFIMKYGGGERKEILRRLTVAEDPAVKKEAEARLRTLLEKKPD